MRKTTFTAALMAVLFMEASASAFCGFYVGGAGQDLYNKATLVVMMRDGTRTVLSMRNAYEGPPENFAMVVPVPAVLSQDDVHTLPTELFDKVDRLAAPRLVEYWEQDPCAPPPPPMEMVPSMAMATDEMSDGSGGGGGDLGVTVEAEFEVGEYDIVILSANDSSGLDTWLRREGYHIPENAEPVLRPYVAQGTKFFVARVDVSRVTFVEGRAMLSPLRVQYESEQFMLPVRLGLVNSAGTQDLIVHILGRNQRFEVANYDNVTIPTNLRVTTGVRNEFGPFYASLFDRLLTEHPNAVVTEYAWDAASCDPCPGPTLDANDLATLGQDVIGGDAWGWTLTRLHYRYTADALGDDLVFRPAPPIVGGRGTPDAEGVLTREVEQTGTNNFQGRYAILHRWEGEVSCDAPRRGVWGGPPSGGSEPPPAAATDLAFASRDGDLGAYLAEDVPELSVHASAGEGTVRSNPGSGQRLSGQSGGCASCAVGRGTMTVTGALAALGLVALAWARRRRRG